LLPIHNKTYFHIATEPNQARGEDMTALCIFKAKTLIWIPSYAISILATHRTTCSLIKYADSFYFCLSKTNKCSLEISAAMRGEPPNIQV
jgi:hypothetical protein